MTVTMCRNDGGDGFVYYSLRLCALSRIPIFLISCRVAETRGLLRVRASCQMPRVE